MSNFVLGDFLGQGRWRKTYLLEGGRQVIKVPRVKDLWSTSSDDGELENLQEAEMYATGEFSGHLYGDTAGGNWLLFKRWFQLSGEELPLNPCEAVMYEGQICLVADFLEKPGMHNHFLKKYGMHHCYNKEAFRNAIIRRDFSIPWWVMLVDNYQVGLDTKGNLRCYDYNFWDTYFDGYEMKEMLE